MPAPKRRKLFVDRAVQGALARRVLFHWIALAFCLFVTTAVIHVIASPFDSPEEQFQSYLAQNYRVFLVLALLTPPFVWDSIKVSHRFAGPILRLRRSLDGLAKGEDVPPLKFRDNDFWLDMADKFNMARDRMRALEAALEERESRQQSLTLAGSPNDV